MKKLLCCFILFICFQKTFGQNPTPQQKLYYTCKVWGFAKYYHSRVSNCMVDWDSVLLHYLPLVDNAVTSNDLNDQLYDMLSAAGPMDLAVTPLPDTLPAELKRNRDFSWFNDPMIRTDVRVVLDTIKNNFRPHPGCFALYNNYVNPNYGFLLFPRDSLMVNDNFATNYPDKWHRLLVTYKYWNIIRCFYPYNYVLDKPWDSTLYNCAPAIGDAPNYDAFVKSFKKMTGAQNDAHVEGLTWTNYDLFPGFYTVPLKLRYASNKYVVVKSGINGVSIGDEIVSVNGLTSQQWEDSLSTYVSAGNPAVFRRFMCEYLIAGYYNQLASIVYKDSNGNNHTANQVMNMSQYDAFLSYYPNDTLENATWTVLTCNAGYVNMGNLQPSDIGNMYNNLNDKPAIIFDIRNYPNGTAWDIANLLYPTAKEFAKFTMPDVDYPGTSFWYHDSVGVNNNPGAYAGKVIILFDQETQSQAEFSCMILSGMPDVVKIGSQTAGADGDVSWLKISQEIHAGYTNLGVYYPNGDSTQRIGIVPDIVVTPTQAGIRAGRDEVLERAIQIACEAASAPAINKETTAIKLFPNPATETLTIQGTGIKGTTVTILVTDVTGRLLLSSEQLTHGNINAVINIRSLSAGVYLLNVKTGEQTKTLRFVKQ